MAARLQPIHMASALAIDAQSLSILTIKTHKEEDTP